MGSTTLCWLTMIAYGLIQSLRELSQSPGNPVLNHHSSRWRWEGHVTALTSTNPITQFLRYDVPLLKKIMSLAISFSVAIRAENLEHGGRLAANPCAPWLILHKTVNVGNYSYYSIVLHVQSMGSAGNWQLCMVSMTAVCPCHSREHRWSPRPVSFAPGISPRFELGGVRVSVSLKGEFIRNISNFQENHSFVSMALICWSLLLLFLFLTSNVPYFPCFASIEMSPFSCRWNPMSSPWFADYMHMFAG